MSDEFPQMIGKYKVLGIVAKGGMGVVYKAMHPSLKRLVVIKKMTARGKSNNAERFKKFGLTHIKTRAERINIAFRDWGHKWLYDREELERRLKEAGFVNIKFCNLRESDYPELRNLETRDESILIAECVK